MRRRLTAAAVAVALVVAPLPAAPPGVSRAAAQSLPDLGDASQTNLSAVQERKLGETIIRQVRASGAYINDPEVNDYLNELGHRLVAASKDVKQDFEFFGVPDPQVNAFALPGGYVGVHTGLILLTQTESELAAVLAHEITHVTQHHMARALAAQKDSMLMSRASALAIPPRAGGNWSGEAASAAIAATQALTIQNQINSRARTYEADRIGPATDAAASGRHGDGMFGTMQRAFRFVEGNAPTYLRTHPITYERIAEAQARAQGHPYRQITSSLDFHLVRALLRSYQGDGKEAVAFFDDSLAEHKYNNEIAAHYGLVASLLRTKDYVRAKKELATLEKIAPEHPMIERRGPRMLIPVTCKRRSSASRRASIAIRARCSSSTTIRRRCCRQDATPTQPDSSSASSRDSPTTGRCSFSPRAPMRRRTCRCSRIATRASTTHGRAI